MDNEYAIGVLENDKLNLEKLYIGSYEFPYTSMMVGISDKISQLQKAIEILSKPEGKVIEIEEGILELHDDTYFVEDISFSVDKDEDDKKVYKAVGKKVTLILQIDKEEGDK